MNAAVELVAVRASSNTLDCGANLNTMIPCSGYKLGTMGKEGDNACRGRNARAYVFAGEVRKNPAT